MFQLQIGGFRWYDISRLGRREWRPCAPDLKRPAGDGLVSLLQPLVEELLAALVIIDHPADGPRVRDLVGVRAPVKVLEDGDELGARDALALGSLSRSRRLSAGN